MSIEFDKQVEQLVRIAMEKPGVAEVYAVYSRNLRALEAQRQFEHKIATKFVSVTSASSNRK